MVISDAAAVWTFIVAAGLRYVNGPTQRLKPGDVQEIPNHRCSISVSI